MNQTIDIIIIIGIKLLFMIGFIYLTKLWLKKKNNIVPIVLYWFLGLFFVFLMSVHIVEWFLNLLFLDQNSLLSTRNSLGSFSALMGLIFYIYLGRKYYKLKII